MSDCMQEMFEHETVSGRLGGCRRVKSTNPPCLSCLVCHLHDLAAHIYSIFVLLFQYQGQWQHLVYKESISVWDDRWMQKGSSMGVFWKGQVDAPNCWSYLVFHLTANSYLHLTRSFG